ncbi:MFS transporter [Streptomyces sp. NPDC006283]|uniref:MFS transporter n=1 Tax=Streptomyces sp. NPDC006283 TaxID=3156741 RepID=UPI0033B9D958
MSLSRRAAFWLLGSAQLFLLFAASAPSPLYPVYQAHWAFSAATVTVVFALYAIGLLLALVIVGALSDHVGRRPVLITALMVEAAAMGLFIAAGGVGWLMAARMLQGIATGAATGAISAGLVDLQPPGKPHLGALVNSLSTLLGLAAGAFGSGLLVQYAPAPTTLVYALLIAAFLGIAAVVALMPETSARRPGALASLLPSIAVPPRIRPHFVVAAPSLVALWALGGFFLSLGPSLTARVLDVHNHLIAGVVIAVLAGMGAVGSLALQRLEARRILTAGSLALAGGTAVTLVGVTAGLPAAYLLGTAVAGFGYGSSFLGALRTVASHAAPEERAALFATIYVVSYLAFSLPAIAAGVVSTRLGLTATTIGYGLALIALAGTALLGLAAQRRRAVVTALAD